jgi:hypothetical protein
VALRGAAPQGAAHFVHTRCSPKVQLHPAEGYGLITARMSQWKSMIVSGWRRMFKPPQASVDRSRLVGMYLSQANRPLGSSVRGSEVRERQDGKFSQNRRRG